MKEKVIKTKSSCYFLDYRSFDLVALCRHMFPFQCFILYQIWAYILDSLVWNGRTTCVLSEKVYFQILSKTSKTFVLPIPIFINWPMSDMTFASYHFICLILGLALLSKWCEVFNHIIICEIILMKVQCVLCSCSANISLPQLCRNSMQSFILSCFSSPCVSFWCSVTHKGVFCPLLQQPWNQEKVAI